ncbi:hypothetical protein [Dietzia sp. NCCP-2495]|uniref:hypothetical protein n=1 Tax=Dietzia sp. NCCP-2495 TaxID=2934675 RepID=UPI0022317C06|nr:hypothetical protein [Dietzia sp. NCCP-2495]
MDTNRSTPTDKDTAMGRLDLHPDDLLAIAPAIFHSLAYSFTWGSLANVVTSVDGLDAAMGDPGRY